MSHNVREKFAAEVRNGRVDFQPYLDEGETLASITSIVAAPAGPTIDQQVINASEMLVNRIPVPANMGVKYRIQAGTAGVTYQITTTVVTSGGQTIVDTAALKVRA